MHRVEFGLWARWWASEVVGGDEDGNAVLRVRVRDDKPTEPEDWRVCDVVLDTAGHLWTRSDHPDWPWDYGAKDVSTPPSGSAEEARPPRPLVLLVRGGKPVGMQAEWKPGRWWRVTDADGDIWCETSVEDEARDAADDIEGAVVARQYVRTESEWRVVAADTGGAA